jgi:hypothetical protein
VISLKLKIGRLERDNGEYAGVKAEGEAQTKEIKGDGGIDHKRQ